MISQFVTFLTVKINIFNLIFLKIISIDFKSPKYFTHMDWWSFFIHILVFLKKKNKNMNVRV